MSEDAPVLLRREGAIAVLTLNNPARLNALNLAMREALFETLIALGADDGCRAIVLTGAGGNFTAGGDVSEMRPRAIVEGRMRVELSTRIFRALVTSPKPVIAAIEGKAFGCGVSFAAASDYAVAARDAQFSCAFVKVGLMADFGAIWSLARRVGSRKAMELCAFAEPFDAAAAQGMQLVNAVCEPGAALDAALAAAEKFAANPPVAMTLLKAALNAGADSIDQAIATEVDYLPMLMSTEDFAEATLAFREKRKPEFTGR
ncbi:MAG: enoyl-CoA hydratase-related protein [Novosphingobium sp.]